MQKRAAPAPGSQLITRRENIIKESMAGQIYVKKKGFIERKIMQFQQRDRKSVKKLTKEEYDR
jgi:hypothetical protein